MNSSSVIKTLLIGAFLFAPLYAECFHVDPMEQYDISVIDVTYISYVFNISKARTVDLYLMFMTDFDTYEGKDLSDRQLQKKFIEWIPGNIHRGLIITLHIDVLD